MRHILGNIFTYVLAALLLVGSLVFAAIRSAQLLVSDEAALLACFEPAPEDAQAWAALGEQSYQANCRNCHGADGLGWDQYPPLIAMGGMVAAPGGREYLIALHLWGVASDRWRAPMPPMGHLQDVEVAAVINYVLGSFGNDTPASVAPITADEVAAIRSRPLSPFEVDALRP